MFGLVSFHLLAWCLHKPGRRLHDRAGQDRQAGGRGPEARASETLCLGCGTAGVRSAHHAERLDGVHLSLQDPWRTWCAATRTRHRNGRRNHSHVAREIAASWVRAVAEGRDPGGERNAQRTAPTIADLCDRYLADQARLHKKPTSVRSDEQNIANRVLPAFGKRKVADLTRADVDRLHKDMRNTPYLANRCLALMGKMFSLTELWGWRADFTNPVRGVKRYAEAKRKRYLSMSEMVTLGRTLDRSRPTSSDASVPIRRPQSGCLH